MLDRDLRRDAPGIHPPARSHEVVAVGMCELPREPRRVEETRDRSKSVRANCELSRRHQIG